jgi:hypothetical protein
MLEKSSSLDVEKSAELLRDNRLMLWMLSSVSKRSPFSRKAHADSLVPKGTDMKRTDRSKSGVGSGARRM